MSAVIFSASVFRAFLSSIAAILLMTTIGLAGLGGAAVRQKQGKGARIAMAVCGLFLLIAGCVVSIPTVVSMSSGTDTVAVRLNDKTIASSSCGNSDTGDTCTNYILETNSGEVYYDFVVNPQAYDLAQVDTCYQVSLYKNQSPLHPAAETDAYHHIESITRIEVADPEACP